MAIPKGIAIADIAFEATLPIRKLTSKIRYFQTKNTELTLFTSRSIPRKN